MTATTIGPYEVLAKAGEGGMGQVYRARDSKLARDVAIKILPESFAADPDRLQRFEREAQTLAALNHPNIAQIYGVLEEPPALVMEFVDGEDLAARLTRGAMPIDEALAIATQIASALEAAHDQGIIHRDLKPANVKVRGDGTVKVLDFGLAKVLAGGPDGSPYSSTSRAANSPTFTSPAMMTQMGMILGTAAYMAPEQARGKAVDRRADIWAFGALVYEMLTRHQAFAGETIPDTLSAILSREPDWTRLPTATPAHVRALLARCLEKDPRKRLQAIGEARIALEDSGDRPVTTPPPARPGRGWLSTAIAVVAALAIGAAATWGAMRGSGSSTAEAARVDLPIAPAEALTGRFAVSPEGSAVAFIASTGGAHGLYVRRFDHDKATKLVDLQVSSLATPAFSADGKWIAFAGIGAALEKVPVDGGAAISLAAGNPSASFRPVWTTDGYIVYSNPQNGLSRVRASGGEAEVLTHVDAKAGETIHEMPVMLPDGKTLLYDINFGLRPVGSDRTRVFAQRLDGGPRRELFDGAVVGLIGDDRLIVARTDGIFSIPFDARALQPKGDPTRIVEDVLNLDTNRLFLSEVPLISVARNGTIVYEPGTPSDAARPLVVVDANGHATTLNLPARVYSDPRFSPDGSRLVVHGFDQERDNWIVDLHRGTLTRMTFDPGEDETPVWSPDGAWIYWTATRTGLTRGLFRRPADGSAPESLIWQGTQHMHLGGLTPDGGTILAALVDIHASSIIAIRLSDKTATTLVANQFANMDPALSADGSLLAYMSDESGRNEIYVQPYPSMKGRAQVSVNGGSEPVWSRHGHELFYRAAGKIMSVTLDAGNAPSSPRPVLDDVYETTQAGGHTGYDVGPNGSFVFTGHEAGAANRVTHLKVLYRPWSTGR